MKILMKMMGVTGLLAGMMMVSGCGSDGGGIAFIPQIPDLAITKSHVGNFTRGQEGAVYTVNVSNAGNAVTDGTVTVVDTLPTGLAATAIGGTGWTCNLGTLTCTRSDVLAAGGSYPAITVTVNVVDGAGTSVTNKATVSGGGDLNTLNNVAQDPTAIDFITVSVNAPNIVPDNAARNAITYEVHMVSNYTYLVNGFTKGDELVFDAGTAVSVINSNPADQIIDVNGSLNGNSVTVHLTGIAPAADAQVFGVASFRTVFGANSLRP